MPLLRTARTCGDDARHWPERLYSRLSEGRRRGGDGVHIWTGRRDGLRRMEYSFVRSPGSNQRRHRLNVNQPFHPSAKPANYGITRLDRSMSHRHKDQRMGTIESDYARPGTPDRSQWNAEYGFHGAIPSSHRSDPSKALHAASAAIDYSEVTIALDAGCGNGRNAIFLTNLGVNVVAVDFAERPMDLAREHVSGRQTPGWVEFIKGDLTRGIPVTENSIDMVVDSYTSCHFLTRRERRTFFENVRRILSPDGYLYRSVLGVEDEYYSQLSETHPRDQVIVDPLNDVPKRLFDKRSCERTFRRNSRWI